MSDTPAVRPLVAGNWKMHGLKAALEQLSAVLAAENPDWRIYWVDPGDMRTQMHQDAFPGEDIDDRPLPDATIPFWAWLLAQEPMAVRGQRFRAQADVWVLP